jgi:hypothetical protein
MKSAFNPPYSRNVFPFPSVLSRVRKVWPTIALTHQFVDVLKVMPKSRPELGKISEHKIQMIGPALMAKPTMNISSAAMAGYPARK